MLAAHLRISRTAFCVAALSLAILLFAFSSKYEVPGAPMDEGAVLVYPELVQHGAVPYRDFETFYGPANCWLLSGVYSICGTSIYVERTVGLFYRVIILLALFNVARRWGSTIAIGCLLLTGCLLLNTGIAAIPWMGAMACALSSIWVLGNGDSRARCVVAATFAGLAILFRVDIAPAITLAALPFLWRLSWARRLLLCAVVMVTVITPLLALMRIAGAEAVINNLFLFPVCYSNPGRRLPFLGVDRHLLQLSILHITAVILNVIAGVVAFRKSDAARVMPTLLGTALFAAGISHQAYQRFDLAHLVFSTFLAIGLLPVSVLVLSSAIGNRWTRPQFSIAMCFVVAGLLFISVPSLATGARLSFIHAADTTPRPTLIQLNDRVFPGSSEDAARVVTGMIRELDRRSKPGERLFVGPADLRRTNYCDTYIYFLMPKLRSATYFMEMNPLSANRVGSRLTSDIESADWLVLNRDFDDWPEHNRSAEYSSDAPVRAVQNGFELVGVYGTFGLFHRKT